MSIESVMTSNQLILCCPLLLQPSILPSIRVFPNELALHIKWPVCLCVCVYIYITHCMICMIYMMYDQTSSTIFWLIFLLILDPGGPVCVYECGWQERGTAVLISWTSGQDARSWQGHVTYSGASSEAPVAFPSSHSFGPSFPCHPHICLHLCSHPFINLLSQVMLMWVGCFSRDPNYITDMETWWNIEKSFLPDKCYACPRKANKYLGTQALQWWN